MPDYSNGKIYKITGGGLTYIGSTIQSLAQRMTKHKSEKKVGRFCSSNALFEFQDCMITLIEDYSCERREQLLARERYWYGIIDCVNKIPPLRNNEENEVRKAYLANYREIHKNKNKDYQKKYFQANKEKIFKHRKQQSLKEQNIKEQNIKEQNIKEQNI